MSRTIVHTGQAPAAIGTYSQAVQVGDTVYLSGQVPLDPATMELIDGDFAAQAHQVFQNLQAVMRAAGGDLNHVVKLNIYLIDLGNFATVNAVMSEYFEQPYPARAAIGVRELPKGAVIEADAVAVID